MSKNVSSTCAQRSPASVRSCSYSRYSRPCPTADAACSSSIADGRTGSPMARMPIAIAPEVTSTTCRPALRRSATCSQTQAKTSRRTAPSSSATIAEPSFATTTPIGPEGYSALERHAGIELEHDPRDLDVIPGLEAVRLEGADDAKGAQPLLDVAQRLLVLDVVPLDQPLDPATRDTEHSVGA